VVVTLYGPDGHVVGARTVGIPAELFWPEPRPLRRDTHATGPVDHYDVQVQGWWSATRSRRPPVRRRPPPVPDAAQGDALPRGGPVQRTTGKHCTERQKPGMDPETASSSEARPYTTQIRGWYRVPPERRQGPTAPLLAPGGRGARTGTGPRPYLLIGNHLHWLDIPVLGLVCPHRVYVFAAESGKEPGAWSLFRSADAIFVRAGEVDRAALRKALAVLKGGGVLAWHRRHAQPQRSAAERTEWCGLPWPTTPVYRLCP